MKQNSRYATVMTIAGSDSGGGAGIQADLKTFSALGCFGTSAITAITVQNTLGVSGIHRVPDDIVRDQIHAVMTDLRPQAVKIGMVHSAGLARTIATALREYAVPVIFDPVMVATSGDQLIEDGTIETLRQELFPLSALITPNLDEAMLLTGQEIRTLEDLRAAAAQLLGTGPQAVLLKGGHLPGPTLYDVYLDQAGTEEIFTSALIETTNTHGTGCTLSAAIAAGMALGKDLLTAIADARTYVHAALLHGKDVRTGQGNGPLNHFFNPKPLIINELE